MLNPTVWQWLILACILIGSEITAPGTFLLWLGLAALASALVKLILPELGWGFQYTLFAVFSILSLFAWKRFSTSEIESDQPMLNQRNQQYIGRTLTLAEAIDNGIGKVIVDDTQWKVSGSDAPVGSLVKVIGANGNILQVESVE